jgi:hypothetical protein
LALNRQPIAAKSAMHQRFIGTYVIFAKNMPQAYRLRLPQSMQCHIVIHISKLKQYHSPDCLPTVVPGNIDTPHD